MSENSHNNRNKPLKNGNNDRFQPKVLFIWLAIFAVMVALYLLADPQKPMPESWTINRVINEAEMGHIQEGYIKADGSGGQNWTVIGGVVKPEYQQSATAEFIAEGRLTDNNLERLQQTGYFKEKPASTLMTELLLTLLPFLLIIGILYILFVRQLKMAGRGAMSFGKSKAKMLTRDKDKVTFKDVAGCDEAKEEVQEVVEFLKDPKKFQKIGGRIPKGALLVGPPGTGKTLLARAVAGEADVPFFSISGSDFVEMFVGVGAARVRDMFEQGRKNAPCIIFIDEIDAVGRQRGAGLGGGNDEREQTLNSLLVEMDGFDAHEGVIIMAATNRPDVLDNALLRPGRFDRQIVIDLPDITGRQEILQVHAKKLKVAEDLELQVIARSTPGFSGADLANLLNEAALLAARYGKDALDISDIDEARDKISFGRERRKLIDDEDKKLIAYHEAGHALVSAVINDDKLPIHKVTIIPRGQALGMAMYTPKKDMLNESQNFLLNRICTAMGGRIAEEIIFGDITNGAASDIKQATKLARRMVCDWGMSPLGPVAYGDNQDHIFLGREISRDQNYSEKTAQHIDQEIRRIVDEQYDRAKTIIEENKDAFVRVAELLLKFETIEGKHVHEVLDHGDIQTEIVLQPRHIKEQKIEEKKDEEKITKKSQEEVPPGAEPQMA